MAASRNKKGYLPEELMSHYRRVLESMRQFNDEDQVANLGHSKSEFVNNVVSSLAEELIQVSQNQTVSNIVESIIAAGSPANLRTLFVSASTGDLSVFFLDRFASHVLEALFLRLPEFFQQQPTHTSSSEDDAEDDDDDDVSQDKVEAGMERVVEFVDLQFEVLATHMYGSHVLRAFLEALSGVPVAHELKKSQKSGYGSQSKKDSPQQTQMQKPPSELKGLFDKYTKKLFRICDYEVHLKDPFFSLLLQAVLMILHKTDPTLCYSHCQTILQKMVESCPESDDPAKRVPDTAKDRAGSYLLELMFKLSSDDLRGRTYQSLLEGRLLYYAVHPAATHVLQTFIASVNNKDLLEKLFVELSKHFEDVLAVGYLGLLTTLAEGCRRLRIRQDDFITVLMEAFHCKEPQERQKSLMKLIASFSAYEVFFSLEEGKDRPAEGAEEPPLKGPINQHGSRLIQELLRFQKPKHAALGLLELQPAEVQMLCCDPAGSHMVDAYFSSPTVLEKNRDIFLRKLKGLLVEVACSKNGSRCLESVWGNLSAVQRAAVAQELSDSQRLAGDRFGHFLHYRFQLGLFTMHRKKWQEQQGAATRRKRMMKDLLLHKTEPPARKKKVDDQDNGNDREPKEDHIEDSVTALFIKQKRQQDAKLDATSQPQPRPDSDMEDETRHTSPFSPDDSSRAEGSPKKKKKKKEKAKTVKDSPVKSSDFDEGSELESVESWKRTKKRHREEKPGSMEQVKKKKKTKTAKDSPVESSSDCVEGRELESVDSAKGTKKKQKGEKLGVKKTPKKKKKCKKSKSGEED